MGVRKFGLVCNFRVSSRRAEFVHPTGNLNGARAGDSIALKFSLDGDQGLNIVTGTTWQTATCRDWTPTGPRVGTDGKLSYKPSSDRYQDIVATSSTWKATCRILQLDLADGTHPQVRVTFK